MPSVMRIAWRDLLAVKFSREGEVSTWRDCWWQAREIARRCGFSLPEWPAREQMDARGSLEPLLAYVGPTAASATKLCDLIVGDPTGLGWPSHVATLVDERTKHALSTSERHGPYALPAMRHSCEYGVWRPKMALAFEEAEDGQ